MAMNTALYQKQPDYKTIKLFTKSYETRGCRERSRTKTGFDFFQKQLKLFDLLYEASPKHIRFKGEILWVFSNYH